MHDQTKMCENGGVSTCHEGQKWSSCYIYLPKYVLLWKNDLLKSLPHYYRLQKLECIEFVGLFLILDLLILI